MSNPMFITDRTETIHYDGDDYRRVEAAFPIWIDLNGEEDEEIEADSDLYEELEGVYQSVDHGKFRIN